MATMMMVGQQTGRGRIPRTVRGSTRTRGPLSRPSASGRPTGRPLNPSRPVLVNSRPVAVHRSAEVTAGSWHLTDRGLAVVMGLGAAVFVAALVVIVLQFIALGAPIA